MIKNSGITVPRFVLEPHLWWLSVGGLHTHTAESEDTTSAAASSQQFLDDGFILLLQRQHDCSLQEENQQH